MANAFLYPLAVRGKIVGIPYQDSHLLFGNWESDNAVDISAPYGTPVFAIADGVIGSQIGPLNSGDPHLEGLRVHLVTANNEAYYAHLSRLTVKAGQHVKAGELLGYSGRANGLDHLHIALEHSNPQDLFGDNAQLPTQQKPQPSQSAFQKVSVAPAPAPAPVVQPQTTLGIVPQIAYPGQPDLSYMPRQKVADTWQLIANLPNSSPDTQAALQRAQLVEGVSQ